MLIDNLESFFFSEGYPQLALYLASPGFFHRGQKKLDHKTRATLVRYLLRMSTRATPFGLMAGYSIGTPGDRNELRFCPKEEWRAYVKEDGQKLLEEFHRQTKGPGDLSYHPTLSIRNSTLKVLVRTFQEDSSTKSLKLVRMKLNRTALGGLKRKKLSKEFKNLLHANKILVPGYTYAEYLVGHEKAWEELKPQEIEEAFSTKTNIILRKPTAVNTLSPETLKLVSKGAEVLQRLFTCYTWAEQKRTEIGRFCSSLERKFPSQEIPLIDALDPDIGVLDNSDAEKAGQEPLRYEFGDLRNFFLEKILASDKRCEEWPLTESDLQRIIKLDTKTRYRSAKMPSSISAKVELLSNGRVFLKGLQGRPSFQTFSRLAAPDEDFSRKVYDIMTWEKEQNPNVIFAEIVDVPNSARIANFNSRRIYTEFVIPLEASLGTWPNEKVIALSDLFVSVSYGRVRLRSKRLNKEVIPLLSTAYNFTDDPNPFLRILSQLATQDHFRFSSWKWGELNQLPYLPRVRYGNVVLSSRRWKFSKDEIEALKRSKDPVRSFHELKSKHGLPEEFHWTKNSDQKLLIDTKHGEILLAFIDDLLNLKQTESTFFEEALSPDGFEYVIPLKNLTPVKQDPFAHLDGSIDSSKGKRIHHIGGDVVYLKLFTNSKNLDQLLADEVHPFLEDLQKKKIIKYAFFIKYSTPSPHVRLRLFLSTAKLWKEFIPKLQTWEKNVFESKMVWNLQIEPYQRDMDGHEQDNWKTFDYVSSKDSSRVLALLRKDKFSTKPSSEKLLYALELVHLYLSLVLETVDEKILLTEKLRASYSSMGYPASDKIRENYLSFWKAHRPQILGFLSPGHEPDPDLQTFFRDLKRKLSEGTSILRIQRLIHLALNRTLTDLKYEDEDELYGLLYRAYLELKHRK